MFGMHYVIHRTNMVMWIVFQLYFISKIKPLLQLICTYYVQSPKWTLENQNLSSSWNTSLIIFLKCKNLVEFYVLTYDKFCKSIGV
jgi:hypothetical protein